MRRLLLPCTALSLALLWGACGCSDEDERREERRQTSQQIHQLTDAREVPTDLATRAGFMPCSKSEMANRRLCSNTAADPFGLMEVPFHPTKGTSA